MLVLIEQTPFFATRLLCQRGLPQIGGNNQGDCCIHNTRLPGAMKLMKWFKEQASPEYDKFYAHLAICTQCQQTFLEYRGQMELNMFHESGDECLEVILPAYKAGHLEELHLLR